MNESEAAKLPGAMNEHGVSSPPARAERPSARRQLSWLLIFATASVVVTWPLALSAGRAPSQHADYVQNIWNLWWMHKALFEEGISPLFSHWLLFPTGVSLARHSLSPLNSFPGALAVGSLDLASIYALLLLAHFALSGWAMARLAYELTANEAGSILAGLVYACCPYHFYYLSQINLATMELVPLAFWLTVRCYREPGIAAPVGLALTAGLLAASCSYYLVYAALGCGLLAAGGRLWAPEARVRPGLTRLALAAGLALPCVGVAAAPLILESLRGAAAVALADPEHAARRSNDLLGFAWLGPPEHMLLSWPTTFGYTAVVIAGLGWRARRAQLFWLGFLLLAWLLSLGPSLHVAGRDTHLPLPHAWLSELPLLSMLRKPDRFVMLSQLALAVLCAHAFAAIAQWRRPRLRRALAIAAPLLVLVEFNAAPLATFEPPQPAWARAAAGLEGDALIELPASAEELQNTRASRAMQAQTIHGKRTVQGYVTDLALDEAHFAQSRRWESAQASLFEGSGSALREQLEREGVALVVLQKTRLVRRAPSDLDGRIVWAPFVWSRRELLRTRQLGGSRAQAWDWQPAALALEAQLGPALYDDSEAAIYGRRAAGAARAATADERPNLVVIVVDTLRKDRVGAYGYARETTPRLDALAKRAVRYDAWYSTSSWTTPATASLLTSLYPTRLQIRNEGSKLQERFVTLPEILRKHGYQTGGVVSNTLVSARWGFGEGFESFDDSAAPGDTRSITSPAVTEKALRFLEARDGRPFFLFLHYFDPHSDYMAHAEPAQPGGLAPRSYHGPLEPGIGIPALRKLAASRGLGPEDLHFVSDLYDGEIEFTDRFVGQVLERLQQLGLFDDTLIVFTSDHGEEFLDHGNFGHARTLFDELIHVPMLIKFPGQTEGRVSARRFGHVDLLPTILDGLGIAADPELSGVSVLASERSSADAARPVFSETDRRKHVRAVVWKDFKLVLDVQSDRYRLFDLAKDPGETRDVLAEHAATAAQMRDELRGWMQREEASAGAPADVEMTDEEKTRLRALGYLE